MTKRDAKRFKIDIQKRWYEDPRIGIFQDIVKETNLPPDIVAGYIRHSTRRNPTKMGFLKQRHVEIVRALRGEGLGEEKITDCLSKLEGFPISWGTLQFIQNDRPTWLGRSLLPASSPCMNFHVMVEKPLREP